MKYEDHFSGHAHAYARHRPQYPDEIYAWLASITPRHELAWDAGTGNGQVAIALTGHFDRVVATDASADQLSHAMQHERVEYRNEPSNRSSLQAGTTDLITAGAAAHWFELDGFYREVYRVARNGAVVALFSYGPRDFRADRTTNDIVDRFQDTILAPYWPSRIQYVHDRYTTLPFPFEELEVPPFSMTAEWNLAELEAFLNTWSASQRYFQEHGHQPTETIHADLARHWTDLHAPREFQCRLFFRVGRVGG